MNDKILALDEMAAAVGAREKTSPSAPAAGDSAAARLIADDQARRERERLARRAEIRQQIAERGGLERQLADLAQQLQLLDEKADSLAAEHQERTGPIQEALGSAADSKRAGLLQKLYEANYDLEQALAVVERMRRPLRKQHSAIGIEYARLPTEQRLSSEDVAAPELRCELFVTKQRLAAAEQRIERARDWVSTFDRQLSLASSTRVKPMSFGWIAEHAKVGLNCDRISLLTFRLAKWRAELLDAEHERHECLSEMQRISTEMIAE